MRTLEWKLRMLTGFSSTTQVDGRSQFEGKSTHDLRFMVSIGIIISVMSIRQNGTGKYTVHPRVQVRCEQTSSIPRHGRVGRGRE